LDFFITNASDYHKQLDGILSALQNDGFFWDTAKDFTKDISFLSLKIRWEKSDVALKLDFVNDVTPHFGGIVKTNICDRTDSVCNILSNKLTALFRYAAKDVADIREIALHEEVDWSKIIDEARQKETGIEIPWLCEILKTIPKQEFHSILWTNKPAWDVFSRDIDAIVYAMMKCCSTWGHAE
jgi:hypothetical protein